MCCLARSSSTLNGQLTQPTAVATYADASLTLTDEFTGKGPLPRVSCIIEVNLHSIESSPGL